MPDIKMFETFSLNDWLAYEYMDKDIVSSLIREKHIDKCCYGNKKEDKNNQQQTVDYYGIRKIAETEYILELKRQISQKRGNDIEKPRNLYESIAETLYNVKKNSNTVDATYKKLIVCSTGGQLYDFILSEDFPKRRHPEYYLALFYAAVVNGNNRLASILYDKHVSDIKDIYYNNGSIKDLILNNIICLFFVKTKTKDLNYILLVNERLIAQAEILNMNSMTAILWLNRSRLYRLKANKNDAVKALEESHKLIQQSATWKQNLYYCLQFGSLNSNREELIAKLFGSQLEGKETLDIMVGWRLSQIISNTRKYSHLRIKTPIEIKNILQRQKNMRDMYENIV